MVQHDLHAMVEHARVLMEKNQLVEAGQLCTQICELDEANVEARLFLGLVNGKLGNFDEAIACFEKVIAIRPNDSNAYLYLGTAFNWKGMLEQAASSYAQVLQLNPEHAEAGFNLGVLKGRLGLFSEAEACFRKVVAILPNYAVGHYNLGAALQAQEKEADAALSYRRAVELQSDYAEAYNDLGVVLQSQGNLDEAISHYQKALHYKPDYVIAHYNLGTAFKNKNMLEEAAKSYQDALNLKADYPEALNALGLIDSEQNRLDEAEERYRSAIRIKPDYAEAYSNLGGVLLTKGQFDAAEQAYNEALRMRSDLAGVHAKLGRVYFEQCRIDKSVDSFRRALALEPKRPLIHSNLLFALHYVHTFDPESLFQEHLNWEKIQTSGLPHRSSHDNDPDPNRRIRVGYVSPDFHVHSVAYFFEPLLANHDLHEVETFCYSDVEHADSTTRLLQKMACHWREIHGKTDEEVAELISADGIDILVDLAGHTGDNRALVFARKLAPIQITYLGYPNTTGLSAMDYRLTDSVADPIGSKQKYTEKLVKLPGCFLCYGPPQESPAVAVSPHDRNGYITFGSFNNLVKLNQGVADTWSKILQRVPKSKLVLKGNGFSNARVRDRYHQLFEKHGAPKERIELVARVPTTEDHMAFYANIDIALDTFPYNGTTTTCEALWMGVPVIVMAGQAHVGRVGMSLLSQVGLAELIAGKSEEYIDIAVQLASDKERLTVLRKSLRDLMKGSALCDRKGFAQKVEKAFREMWQNWCMK